MNPQGILRRWRAVLGAAVVVALAAVLAAIETHEVSIGRGGVYDGQVLISRDAQGRMIFRDTELTTPTTLFQLWAPGTYWVETLRTQGPAGTAPVSAGNGELAMTDVATQLELDLKADRAVAIVAGAGLTGGGDLSTTRTLALGTITGGLLMADNAWAGLGASAGRIEFDDQGTDEVNFLSANVGIGTATPAARLHVENATTGYAHYLILSNTLDPGNGGTGLRIASANGAGLVRQYGTSSAGVLADSFGMVTDSGTNRLVLGSLGDIVFYGGNALMTGHMWLDAAGRLGVGTNSPDRRLDVLDAANPQLRLTHTDGSAFTDLQTDAAGKLSIAPSGGNLAVAGDLDVQGALWRRGQRLVGAENLLDNPDFTIWQRNVSMTANGGGDAGGTMTYPVPGTQSLGADRWQASRAGTAMTALVSRAAPPAGLPTAADALKIEATSGSPCRFYIHQTLPRERTRGLRGRWVTFAISVHMSGPDGGNAGLYATVGGAVVELARYAFASSAGAWNRIAVAAQVPADADCLLVSIQPELSASGTTTAHLANAALVEGRLIASGERAVDPAQSALPPLPRDPAADLAACQRYYECGSFSFTIYAPDTLTHYYAHTVAFVASKAASPAIELSNLNAGGLIAPLVSVAEQPPYVAGRSFPSGFTVLIEGEAAGAGVQSISADWTARCAEPQ